MRLLTEEQGRQGVTDDAIIVREAWKLRLFFVLLWTTIGAALASAPEWMPFFPELKARGDASVLRWIGGLCLLFGLLFYGQTRSAMRSSAWLAIISREEIRVKFRSYMHWRWPAQDLVVLSLSRSEVDRLMPHAETLKVRTHKGTSYQKIEWLDIRLRDMLPKEIQEAIATENTRQVAGALGIRGRTSHKPVLVQSNGGTIRLAWQAMGSVVAPSTKQLMPRLSGWYLVRPDESATALPQERLILSGNDLMQIKKMAEAGDVLGAIGALRQRKGYSLAEAKRRIESGDYS